MNGIAAAKVRNFTLAGHSGSGKTLLADTMLHKAGVSTRVGRAEEKTSISDFRPEEHAKGHSLFATPLHCKWNDHQLFFVDTPGNSDFLGDTTAALSVSDTALIVIDCASGIEFGTMRAMRIARDRNIPRAIYINGMDRENAEYWKLLSELQETYGKTVCIPITLPVGQAGSFERVVHVLRSQDVPDEIADQVEEYKTMLMDTVAEEDEELMMRYLEGEELTEEEISKGLHQAFHDGHLLPVFCGSADQDHGITELMNGIVNLFPAPLERENTKLKTDGNLEVKESGDGIGFVFKSVLDPFIGQLTYMRVYSGKMPSDADVQNLTQGHKERLGSLIVTNGKEQENVDVAVPGMIVAIAKLKQTHINDTLVTGGDKEIAPIKFPKPTASFAVYSVKRGDEEKIGTALNKLAEEDPTIVLEHQDETGETLLYGMGDQHLRIVIERVETSAKVEVDLRKPKVPYRETITSVGDAQYRHKKQSGGHGQFAEVHLRLEPMPEGYEFVNEVTGGNIPKNFIPGVEKGVQDAMQKGPLANCSVINLKVAVYDGKHHPVDSSDMAFQIASRSAFREAMQKAKPILLEPIMHVAINTPDEYMGDIHGDLNHRRGRILGMGMEDGMQIVEADVPLAEMHSYSSQLRSLTHGRGSFHMEFSRYEQVPGNVAKQVQADAAAEAEAEG